MYPFWDRVIWPVVQATKARRIVEIGALRGETTALMLERLGPDTELHVIDPVPEFDPAEHEQQFPGRYIFHRDVSHNVLPQLPAVDVALVDGDHNWFTVYHELRMLSEGARKAGALLPVLIMHDVLWPYGRRDLYYVPERVPEEFRQPYEMKGIRPGTKRVLPQGGLNPLHYNAVEEGGARNGVMTALEDFIDEYDRPLRVLVLPIYFGLAIVVEEARLEQQPELARLLDHFEAAAGKDELLQIAESTRLQALLFQHNAYYGQRDTLARGATRYLDLLAASLLDELYLDHELRLQYLATCIELGKTPERPKLGDPVREMQLKWDRLVEERRSGALPSAGHAGSTLPFTDMGRARIAHLRQCLEVVREAGIAGDLVEYGTGRGGGAMFMRGYLAAHEMNARRVWVADRFRVDERPSDPVVAWSDLNTVRDGFARFGLLDDHVRFLQGPPADTLPDAPVKQVALLRIGMSDDGINGADDVAATLAGLYDRLAPNAFVLIDEYDMPERSAAVDAFRAEHGITAPIERVGNASAFWRNAESAATAPAPPTGVVGGPSKRRGLLPRRPRRAPLAPPAPAPPVTKDLSVVVVFYNMQREAARTLHSLTRGYQRGIDGLDYEVIVVENGSAPEQKLGEKYVRSFGPEFRYLDLGTDATPTPVDALNRGVAIAAGRTIVFMIDGAHVLTPSVLRYGMAGLSTYEPAIVVTQQWYVGPGQQPDAMLSGYDQSYEDELFREIEWPVDGYRLFDIGHFIGDRDWFDGLWESNCIFVPRKLLEQYGSFDESFDMAGGGYANLDFYERIGAAPDVNVVTILGEGSFHQVHGGTTTNRADPEDRRSTIVGYADHFADLRGRSFRGAGKTLHYVGTMIPAAQRTRARRMTASAFHKGPVTTGPDGQPTTSTPIPDDLKSSFTDAFWHSLAWRDTTWLGHRVAKAPTDLIVYQELIERIRPDWIIETGSANGGRALFLASVCELLDHGRVVSIDPHVADNRAEHPRITYIEGQAQEPDTFARVQQLVGDTPHALLILGSLPGTNLRIEGEFNVYGGLVPVDSYVIVENTIVNGHPVWPGFGPGPLEAVKRILAQHGEFVADTAMEKYGLTFNPMGFLKRVR
jgi:cephalosporin hydroxylase